MVVVSGTITERLTRKEGKLKIFLNLIIYRQNTLSSGTQHKVSAKWVKILKQSMSTINQKPRPDLTTYIPGKLKKSTNPVIYSKIRKDKLIKSKDKLERISTSTATLHCHEQATHRHFCADQRSCFFTGIIKLVSRQRTPAHYLGLNFECLFTST